MIRPRILVVDDSATARLALSTMLSERFDVHTAGDGEEGVAAALKMLPHLILMDVVMPVMGGLEACRALREEPMTQGTPIIMVTAQNDEWDVEAGYVNGCTDYVIKPVDRVELQAKVDSCLAASTQASDA